MWFRRLVFAARNALLAFALSAATAAAETAPPAQLWEHALDLAALKLDGRRDTGTHSIAVGADGAVLVALAVRAAGAGAKADTILLVAKIGADGKLSWAKTFPAVLAAETSLTPDIGGGRIAVFAGPPDSETPAAGRGPGHVLVLRADGTLERDIVLRHPGRARPGERKIPEPNQLVLDVGPGHAGGLLLLGEFGPGPSTWYLAALDRAGRRLWEHSGWRDNLILTRVRDARIAADGKVEALVIRGALSEQHPANAVLQTYGPGGRLLSAKELGRGTFGCYRFADDRTIVALFETEIVWMTRDGRRLRALPNADLDCDYTQGPDGTLVWVMPDYDKGELKVLALAPGATAPTTSLIAGGERAAAAVRGGFAVLLAAAKDARPGAPVVIRRYGAP